MVADDATRHAAAEVRPLADAMRERLSAYAERAEIGGSLRRGKADVKDIEIVVLNPTPDLYVYTEKLVAGGHAEKAVYSDGKHRWGMKYRGLLVQGVKVELFCADSDNWGYQFWLRTGPGDANQAMVTALKYRCTAFRVDDGYLWRGEHKLHVADEVTLFKLFGIPFMAPDARTAAAYKLALGRPEHAWGDPAPYVILPKEIALLDDRRQVVRAADEDHYARWRAEAACNMQSIPRTYYRMARRALERGDDREARRLVGRANKSRVFWGERAQ